MLSTESQICQISIEVKVYQILESFSVPSKKRSPSLALSRSPAEGFG